MSFDYHWNLGLLSNDGQTCSAYKPWNKWEAVTSKQIPSLAFLLFGFLRIQLGSSFITVSRIRQKITGTKIRFFYHTCNRTCYKFREKISADSQLGPAGRSSAVLMIEGTKRVNCCYMPPKG